MCLAPWPPLGVCAQSPLCPPFIGEQPLPGPPPHAVLFSSTALLSTCHVHYLLISCLSAPLEGKLIKDRSLGAPLPQPAPHRTRAGMWQVLRERRPTSEQSCTPSPGPGEDEPSFQVTGDLSTGRAGQRDRQPPGRGDHSPPGAVQRWAGSPGSYPGPSSGSLGTPQTWEDRQVSWERARAEKTPHHH